MVLSTVHFVRQSNVNKRQSPKSRQCTNYRKALNFQNLDLLQSSNLFATVFIQILRKNYSVKEEETLRQEKLYWKEFGRNKAY